MRQQLLKSIFILFLPVFAASSIFAFALPQDVSAQAGSDYRFDKEQEAQQEAAEKFCGKGDGGVEKACRTGYRHGYSGGRARADACDSNTYNKTETARCLTAYDAGQDKSGAGGGTASFAPKEAGKGGECGHINTVKTKFDFGCLGKNGPANMGPVEDMLYTIIRFLSVGIGIVVVIFIIISGLQYSASEGNPEATQAAKNRIRDAMMGLFFYLLTFALVQYLVPGGLFSSVMIVPDMLPDIIRLVR